MSVLVLSSSPRPDGNSHALAAALADGVRDSGRTAEVVALNDVVHGLLRDCRTCRGPDGGCSIGDGFARLVHESVVPAEAIVYATPLYWYGMAAAGKNFFDRLFCYVAASYPRAGEVVAGLTGKRVGLLVSSEETFPVATAAVVAQVQEASRYLRQDFVGVVHGVGNRRGEIVSDPSDPIGRARALGAGLLDRHHSDYTITTERPGTVWPAHRVSGHTPLSSAGG